MDKIPSGQAPIPPFLNAAQAANKRLRRPGENRPARTDSATRDSTERQMAAPAVKLQDTSRSVTLIIPITTALTGDEVPAFFRSSYRRSYETSNGAATTIVLTRIWIMTRKTMISHCSTSHGQSRTEGAKSA